jgi:ABC-type sugar transport system permease subunit
MVSLANGVAIPRARTVDRRAFRYKGYLLVLPAVVYVLALIGFPLAMGIWYSLTDCGRGEKPAPGQRCGVRRQKRQAVDRHGDLPPQGWLPIASPT